MAWKKKTTFTRNQAHRLIRVLTAIRDDEGIPSLAAIDLDTVERLYLHLGEELAQVSAMRKAREDLEQVWLMRPSGKAH